MFLVLIRRRRARLQLHKTATGLQPICNQIRPPYDRHTSVWRSVCAATDLQPHAIRYDRHTTAIRLFGGLFVLQPICNLMQSGTTAIRPPYVCLEVCLCCNLSATSCNQVRPPYDRHTSVWRSVCTATDLQPDTTAIRPQPGTATAIRYTRYRKSQNLPTL